MGRAGGGGPAWEVTLLRSPTAAAGRTDRPPPTPTGEAATEGSASPPPVQPYFSCWALSAGAS
eukprot:12514764-Alexandrium_andersonii.AAC.1